MVDLGAHFTEFKPQASQPVTNLSPHVDGGQGGSTNSNVSASASEAAVLRACVGVIVAALVLLYLLGGLAFRSARL